MTRYLQYITSPAWKVKRQEKFCALPFEHHRCKICKDPEATHLHHKTYKRLGREKLSDLILLCEECHAELHRRVRAGLSGLSKTIGIMKRELRYKRV